MKRLLVTIWLVAALASAATLSNLEAVKIGYTDFTSFDRERTFRFERYAVEPEPAARWEFHRDRHGHVGPRCERSVESETPEPGYEWALGLLLVSVGCFARAQKHRPEPRTK
jgi:hypothetical protein